MAGLCNYIGKYLSMRLLLSWIQEFVLLFLCFVHLQNAILHVSSFCENLEYIYVQAFKEFNYIFV